MSGDECIGDDALRQVLETTRTIAMIGASPNADRDSHRVMRYLQQHGYRVVPVNPVAAGETILGETVQATLADIAGAFELVDVFRRADAVPGIVDEILALSNDSIATLWLQLGIRDDAAAARARGKGLTVIQNRCMKIEHSRLIG